MSRGELPIRTDRGVVVGHGLVKVALRSERLADGVEGGRIIGLQVPLLLQGRQRLGVALRCEQRPAHTAAGERQSGVDRHCGAVRLQRQPVASLLAERVTEALVCARGARVRLQGG